MFLLNWLPDIVIHTILILGCIGVLVSFVLNFISGFTLYKVPVQIVGILLLSFGLYFEGALAKEDEYGERVAKLEADLLKAQIRAEKVNTEVVTKFITKKQVIKEKGETITEYIDREITKVDPTCKISDVVIKAHNAAASNDPALLTADTVVPTDDHNSLAKPGIKLPVKTNE
jgi:hypothetical protein